MNFSRPQSLRQHVDRDPREACARLLGGREGPREVAANPDPGVMRWKGLGVAESCEFASFILDLKRVSQKVAFVGDKSDLSGEEL